MCIHDLDPAKIQQSEFETSITKEQESEGKKTIIMDTLTFLRTTFLCFCGDWRQQSLLQAGVRENQTQTNY
jgi:hypothetical protein